MDGGSGCNTLLSLWAVGLPGVCADPNIGFKFGKGLYTRVKMEVSFDETLTSQLNHSVF